MLYAVSEIVFFLLLATLLGVGLGWWMARSDRISVVAAMDRSGAHAASDRELTEARGEIAQLTAKLAIATEAIRELEHEGAPSKSSVEDTATINEIDAIEVFPEVPAAPVELRSAGLVNESAAEDAVAPEIDSEMPVDEALPEIEADITPPDDVEDGDLHSDGDFLRTSKDRGGKRLSARVAEASVFSRRERAAPKIKFDSDD
jgi:hypothetical protein